MYIDKVIIPMPHHLYADLLTRLCGFYEYLYASAPALLLHSKTIKKLLWTIADIAGEPTIKTEHLAEALQYRQNEEE